MTEALGDQHSEIPRHSDAGSGSSLGIESLRNQVQATLTTCMEQDSEDTGSIEQMPSATPVSSLTPTFGKAVVTSLLCLIAAWGTPFALMGIVRSGNVQMFLWPLAWAAVGLLWIASMIAACRYFWLEKAQRPSAALQSLTAAAFYFVIPLIIHATMPMFIRFAELSDLNRVGISSLRAEVKTLCAMYVEDYRRFSGGYFGGKVPSELMPPKLRELSVRAAYVSASGEGVVVVTDGMGGWRGGYMITPTESTYVPEGGRQITDGVFYVITR